MTFRDPAAAGPGGAGPELLQRLCAHRRGTMFERGVFRRTSDQDDRRACGGGPDPQELSGKHFV